MLTPSTPPASLTAASPMPKRPKPPKPEAKVQYHHGDLKRALIDAALELAESEGLEAVTTRALARKLDVSHAAPARHFPNRGALLAEVAAEAFERFSHALSRAGKGLPSRETFAAMGRAYVRFALDHPALIRLMFSPELQALTEPSERLAATSTQAYEVLQTGARSALGAGASEDEVSDAAFFGWSVAHGAAALWLDGPLKGFGPKQGARARFLAQADRAIDVAASSVGRHQS
jgi:AcrR family transcriptional regulator